MKLFSYKHLIFFLNVKCRQRGYKLIIVNCVPFEVVSRVSICIGISFKKWFIGFQWIKKTTGLLRIGMYEIKVIECPYSKKRNPLQSLKMWKGKTKYISCGWSSQIKLGLASIKCIEGAYTFCLNHWINEKYKLLNAPTHLCLTVQKPSAGQKLNGFQLWDSCLIFQLLQIHHLSSLFIFSRSGEQLYGSHHHHFYNYYYYSTPTTNHNELLL